MINIPVILVMLGAAALLWGFGIEPKLLKTSVYRIRQPELAGLKIVFASAVSYTHLTLPTNREV